MKLEDQVANHLRAHGIRFALIGGLALAARGHARSTLDVDVLVTDPSTLRADFWSALVRHGVELDLRKDDFDDPLAGVITCRTLHEVVDVIVGRFRWMTELVERAEVLHVGSVEMPVARAADLILLKLYSGGFQDLNDVRVLTSDETNSLAAEVEARITALGPQEREAWNSIRLSLL